MGDKSKSVKNKKSGNAKPTEKQPVASTEPSPQENISEKLEKELDQAKQDVLYLRAEMENTRKRLFKEQQQRVQFANEKILMELLPVIDIFEKAMMVSNPVKELSEEAKNFVTGVEATYHELRQVMEKFGIQFVGNVGEPFDPNLHEAISHQESDKPADTVLQVFQVGCQLNGRILKPAKVVVSKAAEPDNKDS